LPMGDAERAGAEPSGATSKARVWQWAFAVW
jgi:hypothetical protein